MADPLRSSARIQCIKETSDRIQYIYEIIKSLKKVTREKFDVIAEYDTVKNEWSYRLALPAAAATASTPARASDLEDLKYIYNTEQINDIEDILQSFEQEDLPYYLSGCMPDSVKALKHLFFVYDDAKREIKLAALVDKLNNAAHGLDKTITPGNATSIMTGSGLKLRKTRRYSRRRYRRVSNRGAD